MVEVSLYTISTLKYRFGCIGLIDRTKMKVYVYRPVLSLNFIMKIANILVIFLQIVQ